MVKSLNKYFILFIIIIACSGGGESPTDSGDDNGGDNTNPYELPNAVDYGLSNQVEIVTLNIRQFPQHSSTKDYVKNLMQKWNADIYFFQEMRSESELISMVDTMPNYSYVFDEESGNLGFALVYKNQYVTFNSKNELWADTPNNDDGDSDYANNASYQFADRTPMENYVTWSDGTTGSGVVPSGYDVKVNIANNQGVSAVDVGNNAADTVYRYVHVFDDQKPVITLNGNISLTLERGYPYVELGATALDTNGDNLTSNIVIDTTNINIYSEGSYIVTYNVTDVAGNSADQVIRTIIVQDTTPPVITISGDNPFYHEMGDVFIDPGVIAIDPSNENLTNNVVVSGDDVCGNVVGTYNIYYDVSDVTGLLAPTQQRVVIVQDTVGPLITLEGDNPVTVERGLDYIDRGATARE